ncbi:MAG: GIY-YIG nuclease family protein [Chitinophagaceae bacterium]|nr:GIY-YIG nuclease family protein [Chitinophagaceae bacterium]
MYYLYILFAERYNLYYVGYTSNYQQRLIQHNTQDFFNTYTSKYRPWKMMAVFECGEIENDAIRLERFIKKQKSRKLIEKLIDPDFIPEGSLVQLVRVPHLRD